MQKGIHDRQWPTRGAFSLRQVGLVFQHLGFDERISIWKLQVEIQNGNIIMDFPLNPILGVDFPIFSPNSRLFFMLGLWYHTEIGMGSYPTQRDDEISPLVFSNSLSDLESIMIFHR